MLRFFRIVDGLIKEMGSSAEDPAIRVKQADWIDACARTASNGRRSAKSIATSKP